MKKIICGLIAVSLSVFMLACAKIEDKATNSSNTAVAELSGIVKDDNGNPLSDVLVRVVGRSEHTYTDDNGEFVIYLRPRSNTGGFVWTEEIGITFQKDGFNKYFEPQEDVPVNTPLSTPMNLTIERGRTTVVRVSLSP